MRVVLCQQFLVIGGQHTCHTGDTGHGDHVGMLAGHHADGLHDGQCEWYPDRKAGALSLFGINLDRAANLLDFVVDHIHTDTAPGKGRDGLGCGKATV